MKLLAKIIFCATLLIFGGCASFNEAMTPSAKTFVNDFDNSIEVIQEPVSAASSLSEGWHTLGFRWSNKAPNTIYLKVGVQGINNVSSVAFNIDGEIYEINKSVDAITKYSKWSTRQFAMPLEKFKELSQGKIVKMKVGQIDTYTVSSFGQEKSGAVVNGKFASFLEQVNNNLSKSK